MNRALSEEQVLDGRVIDVKFAVPKEVMGSNKIFVGGLGQGVHTVHLRSYFETYGEIIDCVVMIDKRTQRSRGFGLKKKSLLLIKRKFSEIERDVMPKSLF